MFSIICWILIGVILIYVKIANQYVAECIRKDCAWWYDFADSCAIPLLAGMFVDSEICRNIFEKGEK